MRGAPWLATLVLLAPGCLSVFQVQRERVTSLRRVALVGYAGTLALDDERSRGSVGLTVTAGKNLDDLASGKRAERRAAQAEEGAAELCRRLTEAFGWEFVDRSTFRRSAVYQRQLALMNEAPPDQALSGVASPAALSTLEPAELEALAHTLQVDGLIMVDLRFRAASRSGYTIAGVGESTRFPAAIARFRVVDARGALLWEDLKAEGKTAGEGLRTSMGVDLVENETAVLTAAAISAFDAVLSHYRSGGP